MGKELLEFWQNEDGQDLVEYTFLLALVALGAASLLKNGGTSVSTIWTGANNTVRNAAVAAS